MSCSNRSVAISGRSKVSLMRTVGYILEQDVSQLIHRLCVDLERLLQELHAE